ncbi:MAG TPA: hypothetical protein VKV20_04395 [Ktedonobacteraceae bacterium]|nr:hypothetical protein [Ktedonobacteraceae bacterium]
MAQADQQARGAMNQSSPTARAVGLSPVSSPRNPRKPRLIVGRANLPAFGACGRLLYVL